MSLGRAGHPAFLPTPEQELLLRSALIQGDEAVDAWRRWQRIVPLDTVELGSLRMLPLAYRNLAALGFDEPVMGRLKGIYRHSWSRNQIRFHEGAQVLAALDDAGVPTLMLKGAALAVLHYRDLGARPMHDLDLLVPLARAHDAVAALLSLGWKPRFPRPEMAISVWHAEAFRNATDDEIDLHWSVLLPAGPDEAFWRAAVPLTMAGAETLALDPTDQLLHVCVHATWPPHVARATWVADAIKVARGAELDWTRLVEAASRRKVTLSAGLTLSYLRETFGLEVPDEAIWRLRDASKPVFERVGHRVRSLPFSPFTQFVAAWESYRRLKVVDPARPRPSGLLAYLQLQSRLEHRWQVPPRAARRLLEFWAGRLRTARRSA